MTKTDRILAVYERFGAAIAAIPDERAQLLHRTSSGVLDFVATVRARNPKATTAQISAGLEQGLRETPQLIQEVSPEWRAKVARAFHEAVASSYSDFFTLESEKLRKVLARGKIRSEAEFYRVRHEIDLAEGDANRRQELEVLYALVDAYEGRA